MCVLCIIYLYIFLLFSISPPVCAHTYIHPRISVCIRRNWELGIVSHCATPDFELK